MTTKTDGMDAATYLEYIQAPGRGWGSGCTLERVKKKTISGVEFTRATAVDNYHGERTSIYVTDDGFEITPCASGYDDPTRWTVRDHWGQGRLGRDMVASGLRYATNLDQAARIIDTARCQAEEES